MKAQCATSSGPTLMTGQHARLFMLLDMHSTHMSAASFYDSTKMAGIFFSDTLINGQPASDKGLC